MSRVRHAGRRSNWLGYLVLFTFLAAPVWAQTSGNEVCRELPPWVRCQNLERPLASSAKAMVHKGNTTAEDWTKRVDQAWGFGLPTPEKLEIFDAFWQKIDESFACFQGLDIDWQALRGSYRPEIAAGVSRGRFAAIMSRLSLALREAHTQAFERELVWYTPRYPGTPILDVGAWGENSHFGAALTPLPDGSGLVYDVAPEHPLGLVRGDIVLGYEGKPWKELYREMINYGLPVAGLWGSSLETYEHSWLMAAGLNWHLFSTIDVRKYHSGQTVHLSTHVLDDNPPALLWATEQLDIPGVQKPKYGEKQLVTWGIIEGTEIGYIYGWGWTWNAESEFYNAVYNVMFNNNTKGLIIDFRFNIGGGLPLSNLGLALLFNAPTPTINFAARCNPADHLSMCETGPSSRYDIPGDPKTFYDKPIAVLTGPGAYSSGDEVALRMKLHPRARFFGKSTNTAFTRPEALTGRSDWSILLATANAFLLARPDEYLTHRNLVVDEDVWLTADDVALGRDTVVEAARRWIENWQPPPPRRPRRHLTR